MRRYATFCGDDYYPLGGFDDYVNSYDTMGDALQFAVNLDCYNWWHIVDIDKSTIVARKCTHSTC